MSKLLGILSLKGGEEIETTMSPSSKPEEESSMNNDKTEGDNSSNSKGGKTTTSSSRRRKSSYNKNDQDATSGSTMNGDNNSNNNRTTAIGGGFDDSTSCRVEDDELDRSYITSIKEEEEGEEEGSEDDGNVSSSKLNGTDETSNNNNDDDDDEEDDKKKKKKEYGDDYGDFTSPGLRWYNPVRRTCGRIVQDEMFQVFIVILIILNAALMGIGTYDFVEDNPRIQKAFDMADFAFLIVFTLECALQLGYHGYQLFKDGWLTFDLFIVLFSWSFESMQVFRAIRVFRAFRLVARLAVLKDLVNAIVAVLPRIGSIMLLFTLVLYIYAVLCTILYGNVKYGEDEVNYFGRLDYSLFTLFQFVTLENWGEISREVMHEHVSFSYIVLSFLTVSSFILYSLVVAVVCDAVAVVEHPDIALRNFEEQMKKERSKTKKRVFKLTQHLDDLSQQQMEILTSVQSSLMQYKSFREDAKESQLQEAEMHRATLNFYHHRHGDLDT